MTRAEAFKLLGIADTDDHELIKRAFRVRSKEAHPDTGGTAEQFEMLKRAYAVATGEVDKSEAMNYLRVIIHGELINGSNPLHESVIRRLSYDIANGVEVVANDNKRKDKLDMLLSTTKNDLIRTVAEGLLAQMSGYVEESERRLNVMREALGIFEKSVDDSGENNSIGGFLG